MTAVLAPLYWRGLAEVPRSWGRSVVTLGVFDGLHRGHVRLLSRAVELGRRRGLPVVLVTFDPHPSKVAGPPRDVAPLVSLDRRAELARWHGADAVLVLPRHGAHPGRRLRTRRPGPSVAGDRRRGRDELPVRPPRRRRRRAAAQAGRPARLRHPRRRAAPGMLVDAGAPAPRRGRCRRRGAGTRPSAPGRRPGTWFTAGFAEHHPDTARALIDMLRATSATGYAGCCEAVGTFDLREELSRVRVPTLVIAGRDDPATPVDTVRLVADRVPGAAFVALPGAHLINVEAADRVNSALADHLS